MKTRSDLLENKDKKKEEKSPFWSFMSGEFLLKEHVVRWYPFVLILFAFAIIATQNEDRIKNKYKKIEKLDAEYKRVKTLLRFENEFSNPEISSEIIAFIREQGFVQKDSAIFKVVK